jgi:hypothetical protein
MKFLQLIAYYQLYFLLTFVPGAGSIGNDDNDEMRQHQNNGNHDGDDGNDDWQRHQLDSYPCAVDLTCNMHWHELREMRRHVRMCQKRSDTCVQPVTDKTLTGKACTCLFVYI